MINILFYVFSVLLIFSAVGIVSFNNAIYASLSLISTFIFSAGLFLLIEAEFISMILVIVYVGAVAIMFLFIIMMLDEQYQNRFNVVLNIKNNIHSLFKILIYIFCFVLCFVFMLGVLSIADLHQTYNLNIADLDKKVFVNYLSTSAWFKFSNNILLQQITVMLINIVVSRVFAQFCVREKLYNLIGKPKIKSILLSFMLVSLLIIFVSSGGFFVPHSFHEELISFPLPSGVLISNTEIIGGALYTDYVLAFQICGLVLLVAIIGAIVLTLSSKKGIKKQDIMDQLLRSPKNTLKITKPKLRKGIE